MFKIFYSVLFMFLTPLLMVGENNKLLVFENKRMVDYENIKRGTILNHTFTLKNVSDSVVIVKKIIPSCNCTKYTCSNTRIEKEQKLKINVVVDTKDKIGGNTIVLRMITEPKKEFIMKIDMNVLK